MATTTNYSWTTPDDTALVKDGAAAIRTLGSSADTTVKALNPGTTAGDVDYYTTSTAKARLAIGTAGQVLTVNSGATAPEWATIGAGGMTLLSTTTLSGATTTISGISGAYNDLFGIVYGVTNATANGNFRISPNNDATIVNLFKKSGAGTWTDEVSFVMKFNSNTLPLRTDANNAWYFSINQYANTTFYKPCQVYGTYIDTGSAENPYLAAGGVKTNSAITSLVFSNTGGNLSSGTVLLYGVK
jgi:hypothetical protein